MTTQPEPGGVPELTLGWRLQMSLAHANVSVTQIAKELDVARGTVSRWLNDRGAPPRTVYIKQWAFRCGVSYKWLSEGIAPTGPHDPNDGISAAQGIFGPGVMIP
jgi:transcriptional regulator with XRE-family HTH domain